VRDLLTALAGAIVLVLVAALAVPPFIDWPAQRATIDRTLSASLGTAVHSEGPISVRLLPSPRVRFDHLLLGDAGGPAVEARAVDAEIALTPLLQGEVRFLDTRIGRAELRLPLAGGDALRLPPRLLAEMRGRNLAIEDLRIGHVVIATVAPDMGEAERFSAEDVRIQTSSLLGPWRIEGISGGVPFRAVSGTPDPEGKLPAKISGGGDTAPVFEVDARFGFGPGETDPTASLVTAEGKARLVVGPPTQAAGAYLPFTLGGPFKSAGLVVRFDPVALEVDPGGKPLRLEGTGRLDLHRWRAGLVLKARRLDLDAFLTSPEGEALLARGVPRGGWGLPVMLDLDASVDSASFGGSDWSNLALGATVERGGGLLLRRFAANAPGEATLTASGEVEGSPLQLNGPVAFAAPRSDELGRLLRRLGADGPLVALFDGRPLELSADVAASAANFSLRNLRAAFGLARLTGNARYVAPDGTNRGRFEAQLKASGIDIAALPPLGTTLSALHDVDVALTLQAQDVRYGPVGSGNGTIAARIRSDGPRLDVDSLDVTNLAGASATLSGTLGADGSGRIAGRIRAPVAAPLVGLLERVWTSDLRPLPTFLREAPLDLTVTLDREAASSAGLRLQAKGTAGGGALDLSTTSLDGRLVAGRATLSTPRAGPWFGRTDLPALQQPGEIRVTADPAPGGLFLTLGGTVVGTTLATDKPLLIVGPAGMPQDGEILIRSADLSPFLTLAGAARLDPGPWPADMTVSFSTEGGNPLARIAGRLAGGPLDARLTRGADGSLHGSASLERLSLPQLAAALAMPEAGDRFVPLPPRPAAALDLSVQTLALGRGLSATKASFGLALDADSLGITNLRATLAEGTLSGSATVSRRGETVAITGEGRIADAVLPALTGGTTLGGRLTAELRLAGSAASPAALAGDLGGSGTLTVSDLTVAAFDPGALGRALARTVEGDDPLREGRLASLLTQELARGPAQAKAPATAPATIIGGVLRAGPLRFDLGPARWVGSVTEDLRDGRLEARGLLTDEAVPPGWQAGPPTVQIALAGTLGAPQRSVDVGPLTNGLATFVLQRELDNIGLIQADDVERQRRRNRIEMERARAAAKETAAKETAAKEAAAREAAAREGAARDAAKAAAEAASKAPAEDPAAKTPD
jgi:hypothetical protein